MKDSGFWKRLKDYFTVYLPKQRNNSQNTINSCRVTWNLLLQFLMQEKHMDIRQLQFEHFSANLILEFLDFMEASKGWKESTRNQRLSCIRSFFKYASYVNPQIYMIYMELLKIPLKKEPDMSRVVNHMSRDSMKSLLGSVESSLKGFRNQVFLSLMYDTAARCGEMLRLRVSDLNIAQSTILLTGKGEKLRCVPVSKEVLTMLQQYLKLYHSNSNSDDYLFYVMHSRKKCSMSADNVARFVKAYAEKGRKENPNIPENVHPHMFRHSRAMHLYQGGMPLGLLSEFLGHENPETTLIYAYADTEMKRIAIAQASQNTMWSTAENEVPIWKNTDIIEQLIRGY